MAEGNAALAASLSLVGAWANPLAGAGVTWSNSNVQILAASAVIDGAGHGSATWAGLFPYL